MPFNLEDLLKPISDEKPSGEDLRYEPVYDEIKEARRQEDDVEQGDWARERKVADWPLVIRLATECIARQSKDLQLAAWLTEALVHKEGFGGLRSGLELTKGLLENFWDTLYPEVEDGDLELRSAPLSWLGLKLDMAVKSVPLVRGGYDLFKYDEAQSVGFEADATDGGKVDARNRKIQEGKLTGEEFEKAFTETPKPFLKQNVAELNAASALVAQIDKIGDKFEDAAPSFSNLKKVLEEAQRAANTLLKNKLAVDPDPVEEVPLAAEGGEAGAAVSAGDGPMTAEPVSREDAVQRVIGAARWLRQNEPFNPASYLMLRGMRWGEVRAQGGHLEPRLLVAPTTALRSQLKSMLLDGKWAALLETCESAIGQPCGRGWLDLQRYAILAASQLGKDYYAVEMALRTALRAYLDDMPEIAQATMMDDTPSANSETLQWIASEFGDGAAAAPATRRNGAPPAAASRESEAADLARAGRVEDAVALLARQVEQERSLRGRFRLRTRLCSILVEAGREQIARPILEELLEQVDAYKLEDWESGPLVAEPMALLIRVLQKFETGEETRDTLYLRICRLDPNLALRCSQ